MLPEGVMMGKSTPKAAASGCGTIYTSRGPAPKPASCTARLSTLVIPYGAVSMIRGGKSIIAPATLRTMRLSSFSVISYSAITPLRSGRTTSIVSETRPIHIPGSFARFYYFLFIYDNRHHGRLFDQHLVAFDDHRITCP